MLIVYAYHTHGYVVLIVNKCFSLSQAFIFSFPSIDSHKCVESIRRVSHTCFRIQFQHKFVALRIDHLFGDVKVWHFVNGHQQRYVILN